MKSRQLTFMSWDDHLGFSLKIMNMMMIKIMRRRCSWSWSFNDNQEDYDKIHGNFCISVWRFALKYIVTGKVIKLRKVDDRIIQVQPLQDSWFTIPSLHSLQILQHGLGIWGNVNDCLWDEATLSFKMFIFSFIALNRFLQLLCQKLMFCHITSSDTQSHQRRNRIFRCASIS